MVSFYKHGHVLTCIMMDFFAYCRISKTNAFVDARTKMFFSIRKKSRTRRIWIHEFQEMYTHISHTGTPFFDPSCTRSRPFLHVVHSQRTPGVSLAHSSPTRRGIYSS